MSEPSEPPKRKPYQISSEATWARVRQAYLGAGLSARECAERFDVSVHALRKRITSEGWSKHALADATGASEPVEEQPEDLFVVRRQATPPPLQVAVEVEAAPASPVPTTPAELAEAAFARSASAFASGRAEEAQRLLKLAAEAQKLAESPATKALAPEPQGPPRLESWEVIVPLEQLIGMTEAWAEQMILGQLRDLPAALIHMAADWRRLNLTAAIAKTDLNILMQESPTWAREIYACVATERGLPTWEELGGYVWGHRDFPAIQQVPAKLLDG